jgi:hypothetical protein
MPRRVLLLASLLALFAVSGCSALTASGLYYPTPANVPVTGTQQAAAPTPRPEMISIDLPLAGAKLALGPVDVKVRAYHPSGIAEIELSVDGKVIASKSPQPASEGDAFLQVIWNADASGQRILSARARRGTGEWGAPVSTVVEVLPGATATPKPQAPPPPPPSATATREPTETAAPPPTATPTKAPPSPTRTPTRTVTPKVTASATKTLPPVVGVAFGVPTATPSAIYYGAPGCGLLSATIRESVSSSLGIRAVSMRYGVLDPGTGTVEHWYPQKMAQAGNVWTGSIATTGVLRPDLAGIPVSAYPVRIRISFVATDGQGVQWQSSLFPSALGVKDCALH